MSELLLLFSVTHILTFHIIIFYAVYCGIVIVNRNAIPRRKPRENEFRSSDEMALPFEVNAILFSTVFLDVVKQKHRIVHVIHAYSSILGRAELWACFQLRIYHEMNSIASHKKEKAE